MRKRIVILGLLAIVAAAWCAPSFAARPIQGTVGEVTIADAAALGQVGFRIWSGLAGGTSTTINNNVASCRNLRCMRNFVTNTFLAAPNAPGGGGYVGNAEATQVYNSDLADQPFYELADANMNAGTANHIAYYGVAGVTANAAGTGQFLAQNCAGTTATNCFGRLDSKTDPNPPLSSTYVSFPSPGNNTIRSIGGLHPVPNVRIQKLGNPATQAQLSWDSPKLFVAAMRPSTTGPAPQSPVLGVSLWRNHSVGCTDPTETDAGWVKVGPFDNAQTGTIVPVPAGGCDYYALTIRMVGPGGPPNEVETFVVGVNSQPLAAPATAVRIVRFDAKYSGRGVVNVNWQTGVEGDIQGFYVNRGTTPGGSFTRVSDVIQAKHIDNSSYSFTDRITAAAGRLYYYQLEIVGRDGTSSNSTPTAVSLPGRSKKSGPKIR